MTKLGFLFHFFLSILTIYAGSVRGESLNRKVRETTDTFKTAAEKVVSEALIKATGRSRRGM